MSVEKKTKIICTISDRNCSKEFIETLYKEGMNVVRINSAHATPEAALEIVKNCREVSDKIAILIDTKGPEIRTAPAVNGVGIKLKKGDSVQFIDDTTKESSRSGIYTNYRNFTKEIPVGAQILIDDGEFTLTVVEKGEGTVRAVAQNDGEIEGRKSINIPGVSTNLPSLSKKDRQYILWAIENKIEFIAHSFVRNKRDLIAIQKILDSHNSPIKLIAKIENSQGVENIDTILTHCYGVMIARGDLGVEIEYEKIPLIQREITHKCQERKKPVIIATQMLHSMIEHPRPTRAEVTDVANAIYQGTDAVMLSGETANGKYPVEAVKSLYRIAVETEKKLQPCYDIELQNVTHPIAAVLSRQLVNATKDINIEAIVFSSNTGRNGRYLSAFRPAVPIYAICYKKRVMRELALSFGIEAFYMEPISSKDAFVSNSIKKLFEENLIKGEQIVGVLGGSFGLDKEASFLEISSANLLAVSTKL
ncbi:MAG: pyruvate kinase [Bacteroidales bacterium]